MAPSAKTPNASSKGARTACKADRNLDQSTEPTANRPSLNTKQDCLRIVDTFRGAGNVLRAGGERARNRSSTGSRCKLADACGSRLQGARNLQDQSGTGAAESRGTG